MKPDVAIIGASSAGLYAAELLADAGMKVSVFERLNQFTPSCRTLIVTPELLRIFNQMPSSILLHKTGVMAVQCRESERKVQLDDPDLIIERTAVIQWLAARARKSGAQFFFDHRFQSMTPTERGARIHFRTPSGGRTLTVRKGLIGADGALSSVAQAAGISRPFTVPIIQAKVTLPAHWDPYVTKVWFDANNTRFFYWLIPESTRKGVVGLAGENRSEIRDLLEQFLTEHGFEIEEYQGGQAAMHHPRLKPWGKVGTTPVYLVGDAAGQVKVTTVGGTVTGLRGSQAAVRAITTGRPYRSELRRLKRELDVHWLIRFLLERLDNQGYECLVRAISPRVQRFLGRFNRDSMSPVFWRLALLEPRMLRVAYKCGWGKPVRGRKPVRQRVAVVPEAD